MTVWKSLGHHGDVLENLINTTNDYYQFHKLGIIKKIPTPIKVTKIKNGKITEGFFEEKSTVDYIGQVQGYSLCFDAKETNLKSLPLSNIKKHQIKFMKDYTENKALAFIIVYYKIYDEYYLIPFEIIYEYYINSKANKRKSIPYKAMDKNFLIKMQNNTILDYLTAVNTYINYKEKKLKLFPK